MKSGCLYALLYFELHIVVVSMMVMEQVMYDLKGSEQFASHVVQRELTGLNRSGNRALYPLAV